MQGMEFQMNGAESSAGTTEAETNLKIALKVQSLLEQSGATVILTRSDENAIYDLDSKTLKQKKMSKFLLVEDMIHVLFKEHML